MKKILIVFSAFLYLLTSCEDNDFCEGATTPRLIITFYDKDNDQLRKQLPIYVWADGKDSIYKKELTDSILIPLDTKSTATSYLLSKALSIDTLDLSYTTSDFFISESCGYIAYFNDFGGKSTENWIDRIEVIVTNIEDETETHIKVFH